MVDPRGDEADRGLRESPRMILLAILILDGLILNGHVVVLGGVLNAVVVRNRVPLTASRGRRGVLLHRLLLAASVSVETRSNSISA